MSLKFTFEVTSDYVKLSEIQICPMFCTPCPTHYAKTSDMSEESIEIDNK